MSNETKLYMKLVIGIFVVVLMLSIPVWFKDHKTLRELEVIQTQQSKVYAFNHRNGSEFIFKIAFELPYTWADSKFELLDAKLTYPRNQEQNLVGYANYEPPNAASVAEAQSNSLEMKTDQPLTFKIAIFSPNPLKELGLYEVIIAGELCNDVECLPLGAHVLLELYEFRGYYAPLREFLESIPVQTR